jgi:hypothetical protein
LAGSYSLLGVESNAKTASFYEVGKCPKFEILVGGYKVRTYKRIVMSLRVPAHVISLTVASDKQPDRATVLITLQGFGVSFIGEYRT